MSVKIEFPQRDPCRLEVFVLPASQTGSGTFGGHGHGVDAEVVSQCRRSDFSCLPLRHIARPETALSPRRLERHKIQKFRVCTRRGERLPRARGVVYTLYVVGSSPGYEWSFTASMQRTLDTRFRPLHCFQCFQQNRVGLKSKMLGEGNR